MEAERERFLCQRWVLFTGLAYFLICSWLSIRFYVLRCAFIDGPYMLINLVNSESFFLPMRRFSFVITEWLPLLLVKSGADFKTIAISYSAGYYLLLNGVFLYCIFLRDYRLALGFALISCLAVKYTFYYLPLEALIGVAAAVAATGWSWRSETSFKVIDALPALVLGSAVVFSHPLTVLTIIFSFGLIVFEKRKPVFGRPGLLATIAILIFIYKWSLPAEPYEIKARQTALENLERFSHLQTHALLLKWIITDYYWLPLMLIAGCCLMIIHKRYLWLLWTLGFTVFFVILINSRNYESQWQFYIEHYLYILSFFAIIPLTRSGLTPLSSQSVKILLAVSTIVLIERTIVIYNTHHHFQSRVKWQTDMLRESQLIPGKRLTLCRNDIKSEHLIVSDKLPYETWFLSKIKFNEDASISAIWGWHEIEGTDSLTIVGTDLRVDRLNQRHFRFPMRAFTYHCSEPR